MEEQSHQYNIAICPPSVCSTHRAPTSERHMQEMERQYPNHSQSTQRLFKWLETALSCFLLQVSLPSFSRFQVYPGVSTNRNNLGAQVLQTKPAVVPLWLPHQWMNGAPWTWEEQHQMCLGILITRSLRTRPVPKFVFPVAPGATEVQREQGKNGFP